MNPTHALLLRPQSEAFQLTVMEATVAPGNGLYQVDLGEGVHPRFHAVSAEGVCTCTLGEDCPAVSALQAYLAAGGEHIPDPPLGYTPVRPKACPICGAKTLHEPLLTSRQRGMGWRCAEGSTAHYWLKMGSILAEKFARNPWLFPPVVLREGQQCFAWDGIQDGDQMLYPGIRRSEIITCP